MIDSAVKIIVKISEELNLQYFCNADLRDVNGKCSPHSLPSVESC